MPQTITVPSQVYTPGNYNVDLNTLPGNSEGCEVLFTREGWDTQNGRLANLNVWMSRDNGATWLHVMGVGIDGGPALNKDGTPATVFRMLFTWPGEAGPNGRVMLRGSDVRVTAEVIQSFQTSITVNSITKTGQG